MALAATEKTAERHNVLFYLVLLYMIIFYTQPGGKIAALGAVRIELLTGGGILVALFAGSARTRLIDKRIHPYVVFFIIAMCLSFLGAVWTHTASDALPVLIQLLKFFAIYFMIIGTVDSERKLKLFIWVYLAMILFLLGEPLLRQNFEVREDGMLRLYGYGQFGHANSLGMNAACNLPFLFFVAAYYRSYLVKIGMAAFALIAAYVAMLTGSRTSYVGGAATVFYIGLFVKHRVRYFLILGLIGLAMLPAVDEVYMERFLSLRDAVAALTGDDAVGGSIGARWRLTVASLKIFIEYPIVGCGLDSFRRVAATRYGVWQQSHSLYLQILTNTGIVGATAFALLIIHVYRSLIESKQKLVSRGEDGSYIHCLLNAVQIFLLARLTCGLFAQTLYSNMWWIAAGLTVVMSRLIGETSEQAAETTTTDGEQNGKRNHRSVLQSWRDGFG